MAEVKTGVAVMVGKHDAKKTTEDSTDQKRKITLKLKRCPSSTTANLRTSQLHETPVKTLATDKETRHRTPLLSTPMNVKPHRKVPSFTDIEPRLNALAAMKPCCKVSPLPAMRVEPRLNALAAMKPCCKVSPLPAMRVEPRHHTLATSTDVETEPRTLSALMDTEPHHTSPLSAAIDVEPRHTLPVSAAIDVEALQLSTPIHVEALQLSAAMDAELGPSSPMNIGPHQSSAEINVEPHQLRAAMEVESNQPSAAPRPEAAMEPRRASSPLSALTELAPKKSRHALPISKDAEDRKMSRILTPQLARESQHTSPFSTVKNIEPRRTPSAARNVEPPRTSSIAKNVESHCSPSAALKKTPSSAMDVGTPPLSRVEPERYDQANECVNESLKNELTPLDATMVELDDENHVETDAIQDDVVMPPAEFLADDQKGINQQPFELQDITMDEKVSISENVESGQTQAGTSDNELVVDKRGGFVFKPNANAGSSGAAEQSRAPRTNGWWSNSFEMASRSTASQMSDSTRSSVSQMNESTRFTVSQMDELPRESTEKEDEGDDEENDDDDTGANEDEEEDEEDGGNKSTSESYAKETIPLIDVKTHWEPNHLKSMHVTKMQTLVNRSRFMNSKCLDFLISVVEKYILELMYKRDKIKSYLCDDDELSSERASLLKDLKNKTNRMVSFMKALNAAGNITCYLTSNETKELASELLDRFKCLCIIRKEFRRYFLAKLEEEWQIVDVARPFISMSHYYRTHDYITRIRSILKREFYGFFEDI